jgi:hypothetical protein
MGRDEETGFQVEQRKRPLLPVSLFDLKPFLRPDLPSPRRRAETPSRLAVAQAAPPRSVVARLRLDGGEHGVIVAAVGLGEVLNRAHGAEI